MTFNRQVDLSYTHPVTGEYVELIVDVPSYNSDPINPNPRGRVYSKAEWQAARKAGIYTGDRADEHRGPLIYGSLENLKLQLNENIRDLRTKLHATEKVLAAVERNGSQERA